MLGCLPELSSLCVCQHTYSHSHTHTCLFQMYMSSRPRTSEPPAAAPSLEGASQLEQAKGQQQQQQQQQQPQSSDTKTFVMPAWEYQEIASKQAPTPAPDADLDAKFTVSFSKSAPFERVRPSVTPTEPTSSEGDVSESNNRYAACARVCVRAYMCMYVC
jgi:hypothetical protein